MTPSEEDVIVKVLVIHVRPLKPHGRNWTKALENRNPVLKASRVKALDWNRHEKNTYEKITHWFKVIRKILQDPAILVENIYNMDETGVMLSMPSFVKVLVGKDDTRDYRGTRLKRTTVTAIECVNVDSRYLNPMIIWPTTTYRSNWITFPTPGRHYTCSDSRYTDFKISLEWLKRVFDSQTKERANKKPRRVFVTASGRGRPSKLQSSVWKIIFFNIVSLLTPFISSSLII